MRAARLLRLAAVIVGALTLAACGHRYAVMQDRQGENVLLLGHDPTAYFITGKPTRGDPAIRERFDGVTLYFASAANRELFRREPAKYLPQYGGFCSSGAAFGIKLGSDPTQFEIVDGRLFIFGDILGKEAWKIDPRWNIEHGDKMWPEAKDVGWRWQSLKRYANKVAWYKNTGAIVREWRAQNPGRQWPSYDPGGMITNLFLKQPGWRAREGYGQPPVGLVGVDPCPPACAGTVSPTYGEK